MTRVGIELQGQLKSCIKVGSTSGKKLKIIFTLFLKSNLFELPTTKKIVCRFDFNLKEMIIRGERWTLVARCCHLFISRVTVDCQNLTDFEIR